MPKGVWTALLFSAVLSCSQEPVEGPRYGGKVTLGATGGLAPLNPIITHSTISAGVFDLIFERLLSETPGGEVAPALAVAWHSSEDYRTWDFQLRKDVKFHDGTPVRAEDVVFTVDLTRQYRSAKEEEIGYRSLQFEKIEVVSPYTVRVHFSEPPNPAFLLQMREHILPKHLIEPQLQAGHALEELPFNKHPVGAGPFQFAGWEGDSRIKVRAFEDYFEGRPYLDTVVVRADYTDTRYWWAGLMQGEVDVVEFYAAEDLESIVGDEAFQILRGEGPAYDRLDLNCRGASVLADRRLRQALNYAINRKAILKHLGGEHGAADSLYFLTGPFLPGSPYGDPHIKGTEQNRALATALLEEAGWLDMDNDGLREKEGRPLELVLLMLDMFPIYQDVVAQLRKDLVELGIKLLVRRVPIEDLTSRDYLDKQKFDILYTTARCYFDPHLSVVCWHSTSPHNYVGYENAAVDRLIEQGSSTYEPRQRVQAYQSLHRHLAAECPTIFICRYPLAFVLRKGIKGTELLTHKGLFRSLSGWYWDLQRD